MRSCSSLRIALLLVLIYPGLACAQIDQQALDEIKKEIDSVQVQIKSAEMEDSKYAGGLIKTLIAARLAILRQTLSMLEQQQKSRRFGIALKYTVDGKPFIPPDASENTQSIERDLADLASRIQKQEAEAARYSGGLVLAMAHSTLATMRNTEAMLDQKRLSIKYGLPQYIGFSEQSVAHDGQVGPNPIEITEDKSWSLVSVQSKVTETNDSWWRYAWRLTIKNGSQSAKAFKAIIEFQDKEGFVIDSANAYDLVVPPNSEETFTGYALVRMPGAKSVEKTNAKVAAK